VALEGSLQDQLFGHACGDEAMQRIKVREGEEREKSKAALQNLGKSDGKAVANRTCRIFFLCGLKMGRLGPSMNSALEGATGEVRIDFQVRV